MKLNELLLAQLEREIASTRKVVERVPDGKEDWKPHPKSMEMGYLSTLVATMFGWVAMMIESDHLDLASGGSPAAGTTADKVALFDKSVESARNALKNTTDEHLLTNWQLRMGERVLDDRARHLMIADTFCHLAHHRGQLSVYLRLNEQPIPSIYGPTADEKWG